MPTLCQYTRVARAEPALGAVACLGDQLERSRPGCPQDNGAHERMHRDMRVELEGGRIGRDQAAFDQWKEQYNHERPYEALQMKTPGEIYRKSKRKWRGTPEDLDYGSMSHRRVHRCGWISYKHEYYQLSTALGGWSVGLKPQADRRVEVWFGEQALGWIDPATSSFKSLQVSENKTGQTTV